VADVIVLDASVLIAYLDGQDSQHRAAESLLAREIHDDFAASTLTLAEVLVAPTRSGRLASVQSALRALEVEEHPFPDSAAVRLAQLRVTSGLKMPDCCVLLIADDARARVASFDGRLTRAADAMGLPVVSE
jgi:predicted nucleic acid-binding protein